MASRSCAGPRRRFLVTLRQGAAQKPPLIAVTGLRGACLWAREMVDALPADGRPVYGLNLPEDDPHAERQDSLQSLAEAMAEELIAEFGDRPLHLVGYSFAGFLAFVLAGLLRDKGGNPGRTILVDPNSNLGPTLPRFEENAHIPVEARLSHLRWEHRLRITPIDVDYIYCPEAFPGPRKNDAEEFALLTGGDMAVHQIATSHVAIIHGAQARKLASVVDGILAGTRQPEARLTARFTPEDLDRALTARDLSLAGRFADAAVLYDGLVARYGHAAEWLHAARLAAHAGAGRRGVFWRETMRGVFGAGHTARYWCILGAAGEKAGALRLSRIAWRRALRLSGSDVFGGFQLVLSLLYSRKFSAAQAVADEIEHRARTPVPALMARAAIAKVSGLDGQCHLLLVDALSRSSITIGHVLAALNQILGPEDHQIALRLIDGALEYFHEDAALLHARSEWLARADAEGVADAGRQRTRPGMRSMAKS
ncbi:thioesterase domain-containing protein [Roseicyclus elongatus]|nr:thioesterase domain-containing protein [Roseibacterium elongatum]